MTNDEAAIKAGCYYVENDHLPFVRFSERFLTHTEGSFAGKPFFFLPWQIERVIKPLFNWKMPDGSRRFRELELWIPKKNGKSTFCAAMALYLMIADGEYGAHIYGAASDREQASIIFNTALAMVGANEDLSDAIYVQDTKKTMHFHETNSFYKVITAEGRRNEGYNIHGLLFDELHTQPNRKLWAALRYGGAARKQSLRIVMSTAGPMDETALWYERFTFAKQVQNEEQISINMLPVVYAADETDDPYSEDVWKKCNPGYGVTINPIEFRNNAENAKRNAVDEAEFKRYRLNWPTAAKTSWIVRNYWMGCKSEFTMDSGDLYVGIDTSESTDMNSVVIINKKPDDSVCIEPYFWIPSGAMDKVHMQNRSRYEKWADQGYLRVLPGPYLRPVELIPHIVDILAGRTIIEIGADRFHAKNFLHTLKEQLETKYDELYNVRLVPYTAPALNESVKCIEELIYSGKLLHASHPIMDWMFGNVTCVADSSGNRKFAKASGAAKIDGFAALLVGMYCLTNRDKNFVSRYDGTVRLAEIEGFQPTKPGSVNYRS